MNPKGTLVDVGCGTGQLLSKITKKKPNFSFFGVNVSEKILTKAKRQMEAKGLKNVKFKMGNVEDLPFEDNSIDFITSSLSLHHWISPISAFNEILRVLKNNGGLLIFDFRRDSRKLFHGFFKFVTKLIVPKALKKVNEPLGSLEASYTKNEINKILEGINGLEFENDSYFAWMFIKGSVSKT